MARAVPCGRCTEPDAVAPWRLHDAARWKAGLPWDASLVQVAAHALRGASPVVDQVRPLLEHVAPFVTEVANGLDVSDGALEDVADVRTIDPTVAVGSAYVPTPQYPMLDAADAIPQSAAVIGPGGFIERLTWYREMLADTLLSGMPND